MKLSVWTKQQRRQRFIYPPSISGLQYTNAASVVVPKENEPKKIWYYSNKGIRNRKIKQLFRNADKDILTNNEDVLHIRRIIDIFNDYGFDRKEIEKLIYSKAQLLQLSKTMLRRRLKGLRSLDLPKESVKSMIVSYPGLLTIDHELSLQKRLNILQELKIFPKLDQQRCLYLIQKCPQLISFANNKMELQEKLDILVSYELHEQQTFQLIMKHPAIFTISKDLLKEKLQFLTETMNGRISLIVKFPRYLTTSMKRLKERHAYLIEEQFLKDNSHLSEKKLKAIVLTSDSDFVYKMTNTKMKDYRDFQKRFSQLNHSDHGGIDISNDTYDTRDDDGGDYDTRDDDGGDYNTRDDDGGDYNTRDDDGGDYDTRDDDGGDYNTYDDDQQQHGDYIVPDHNNLNISKNTNTLTESTFQEFMKEYKNIK